MTIAHVVYSHLYKSVGFSLFFRQLVSSRFRRRRLHTDSHRVVIMGESLTSVIYSRLIVSGSCCVCLVDC